MQHTNENDMYQRNAAHAQNRAADTTLPEDGAGNEGTAEAQGLPEEQPLPENLETLCREHFCPQCAEKAAAEEARLRAAAEMDNFKKRLTREHEEQVRYAAEKILRDILPGLDNLELAMQYGSRDEACRDMLTGVIMTHKLMMEALARHGLTAVGAEGDPFTPELHEAVGFADHPDLDANTVAQVLQRGYKLGDRLLRPARVMVSQG